MTDRQLVTVMFVLLGLVVLLVVAGVLRGQIDYTVTAGILMAPVGVIVAKVLDRKGGDKP